MDEMVQRSRPPTRLHFLLSLSEADKETEAIRAQKYRRIILSQLACEDGNASKEDTDVEDADVDRDDANVGEDDPNVGGGADVDEDDADVGEEDADAGEDDPDMGEDDVEVWEEDAEISEGDPDVGEDDPDVVEEDPDEGEEGPGDAAHHPQAASVFVSSVSSAHCAMATPVVRPVHIYLFRGRVVSVLIGLTWIMTISYQLTSPEPESLSLFHKLSR
jgi:hypothetical protein